MCHEMNELQLTGKSDSRRKGKSVYGAIEYREPPQVRTKGRPKRIKSLKEKVQKKLRLCRGCGKRGVSHDKRNCPALLSSNIPKPSRRVSESFNEDQASEKSTSTENDENSL